VNVKSLFTIHAGELLVGELIERKLRSVNIWVPAKDTGVDLLITDSNNRRAVSLQVKFSRDFLTVPSMMAFRGARLKACGWWNIKREGLAKSKADYWVFVLLGFAHRTTDFVILKPAELLTKFDGIHGRVQTFRSYLWVTDKGCWDARDLDRTERLEIAEGRYTEELLDFTAYLNQWSRIQADLKC
jgi:hypothetical protein